MRKAQKFHFFFARSVLFKKGGLILKLEDQYISKKLLTLNRYYVQLWGFGQKEQSYNIMQNHIGSSIWVIQSFQEPALHWTWQKITAQSQHFQFQILEEDPRSGSIATHRNCNNYRRVLLGPRLTRCVWWWWHPVGVHWGAGCVVVFVCHSDMCRWAHCDQGHRRWDMRVWPFCAGDFFFYRQWGRVWFLTLSDPVMPMLWKTGTWKRPETIIYEYSILFMKKIL